jgi:hypothetical protein
MVLGSNTMDKKVSGTAEAVVKMNDGCADTKTGGRINERCN